MNAKARKIERTDILPPKVYAAERKERRSAMMPLKRVRRVDVGPYCTFYFESYDTMWLQVHEMLHIEKGGDEQIDDELRAYNPLIPQGSDLVATVMFEIDDPVRRNAVLLKLTGVEETMYFEVGAERVKSDPEHDIDRTASDGKTSSVHFLHFRFTPAQIAKFRDPSVPVILGVDHPAYAHMTRLSSETRTTLAKDFA
ncbi:MAG: DUF3501 family protein [Alphaproteobacteria bacterium]